MAPTNDTIEAGKRDLFYLLDLGAQSCSKDVRKTAQGCPWYSKWSPEDLKRLRKWSAEVARSVKIMSKTNWKLFINDTKKQKTSQGKL